MRARLSDAVCSLKDRAELIAKYSSKTRELLGTQKSSDRTFTNSENNRGQNNEKSAENALYPLWQGLQDDYRTYCCIASSSIGISSALI